MNRTPTILSSIALLGVIILAILHFSTNKHPTGTNATSVNAAATGGIRVAYIDIDTFESRYTSLKAKKEEFKVQQASMEGELQRSAAQMQSDYADLQRRAEAHTLSQSEGEAAQKRLGQMQQTLEMRRQAMSTQFQDKLEAFNRELHRQMDEFLEGYTKDHRYDYVLSYTRSNPIILYADKGFNITEDVVKGMNEHAAKSGNKDTAKGK